MCSYVERHLWALFLEGSKEALVQVCALVLQAAGDKVRVASLQERQALPEPHAAHKVLGHRNALLHSNSLFFRKVLYEPSHQA